MLHSFTFISSHIVRGISKKYFWDDSLSESRFHINWRDGAICVLIDKQIFCSIPSICSLRTRMSGQYQTTRMHSSRMRTARSSRVLLGRGCLPQYMLGYPPGCGPGDPHLGVGLEIPLGVGLETLPGVGLETPQVWAWRPPRPDPSTSPWVWTWRPPKSQIPQIPPWVWAWRPARYAGIPPPWRTARHAGIPPAMYAGIPPPTPLWTEFLTHASENITLPQTSFSGGNKVQQESIPVGCVVPTFQPYVFWWLPLAVSTSGGQYHVREYPRSHVQGNGGGYTMGPGGVHTHPQTFSPPGHTHQDILTFWTYSPPWRTLLPASNTWWSLP